MSDGEPIAEAVDGFASMKARQMTTHEWTVISWRNGSTTAHTVDLHARTCTCEDMQYNTDGEEVCAHVVKAGHAAARTLDVSDALSMRLLEQQSEVQSALRALERRASGLEAEAAAAGGDGSQAGGESSSEPAVEQPAERFEELLESEGLDPGAFDIWIDDQYGSLQIEQNGYLEDDQFSQWQDVREEYGIEYDVDGDRNYLSPDRFGEVLG